MTNYVTRSEAVEREVIAPIEASAEVADARAEYDVETIAEQVISLVHVDPYATPMFRCVVEPDEFWQIVAANEVAS